LDSGFDRIQALRWNLLFGAATIPGAVLAYLTLGSLQTVVGPILALSQPASSTSDWRMWFPDCIDVSAPRWGLLQVLLIVAGIGTVIGLQWSLG